MTVSNLTVIRRRNRDRSITYTARWVEDDNGGKRFGCRKLARTGPRPDRLERLRTRTKAKAMLAKVREDLGVSSAPKRSRPFAKWLSPADVVKRYLMWLEQVETPGSYANKERACLAFVSYLSEHHPKKRRFKSLSRKHVAQFREHRLSTPTRTGSKRNPNTVRAELCTLRDLWDFAVRQEFSLFNRAREALLPTRNATAHRIPETDTVCRMIYESADEPLRLAAIYLLAATGMRQGELRALRVKDYDSIARLIRIPKPDGVRRRETKWHERDIPVCDGAQAVIRGLAESVGGLLLETQDGKPLTSQINAWLRPYHITPHDLRRWFYTSLEAEQIPAYIIDDMVGHAPSASSQAYRPRYGSKPELRRQAAELIDAVLRTALKPKSLS